MPNFGREAELHVGETKNVINLCNSFSRATILLAVQISREVTVT